MNPKNKKPLSVFIVSMSILTAWIIGFFMGEKEIIATIRIENQPTPGLIFRTNARASHRLCADVFFDNQAPECLCSIRKKGWKK